MAKQFINTLSAIVTLSLLVIAAASKAQENIIIDPTDVLKKQLHAPIGENLNFLMSSDKKWPRKVSMQSRIKEMKLSILRFPYGHLGDNYLFTDAPFDDGINGLTPRVSSIKEDPGRYYWAVDDNGYFKDALDFDEYMAYINKLNGAHHGHEKRKVEPLIMVNMLSYDNKQYPETVVSFEDLIRHATEWVKYANITRGFKIKYWQLGNEVASHTDKATYLTNFVAMAKAMKAVDPTIQIGFGEDGRRNWLKPILANPEISKYIDFISPHQYLHNKKWSESYQHWRDYAGTLIPKIDKFQRYADKSEKHKDVPIIVTEYGATGGHYPERDPKGLTFFKALKGTSNGLGYLQVTENGKRLTEVAIATKLLTQKHAIDITLLDDAWLTLKAANNHYIKAPLSVTSSLTTGPLEQLNPASTAMKSSMVADAFKWRLLEVKKHQFYLESKLHPGLYVSYVPHKKHYLLAAKNIAEAAQFTLKSYQPVQPFPRQQARMISAVANQKILCLQADNSLRAKLFRSTIPDCQFSIKSAGKGHPKGALLVYLAGSKGAFISRKEDDSVVNLAMNKANENSLWKIKYNKDNFQLHAYGDNSNFLQVTKQGLLSVGGKKSEKTTKFRHSDIPNSQPEPQATFEQGNYDNDLWKSLVFAEMSLGAMQHKNVSHLVHWNTHTSWHGKYGGHGNAANSLENTLENKLTPIGQVLKLINSHSLENILNVKQKHGFIRAYSSINPADGSMSIILLNKNDNDESTNIELKGYQPEKTYQHWLYSGTNPEDEQPAIAHSSQAESNLVSLKGNKITIVLPATSLTVIRLNSASSTH